MITKIISGGQTGADYGGLLAGYALRLSTGGTAPKSWITEDGINPALANFGLVECKKKGYIPRTRANVANSDGTLLMGEVSGGTLITFLICKELNKPYIIYPTPLDLKKWINKHNIHTLNVAGNRESKHPGIRVETFQLLYTTLSKAEER
jgi:hypothetical protein